MIAFRSRKRRTKPLEIYSELYVGDYFADTIRFSADEHAAFRLLLLHMWLTEQPDRLSKHAKITGVSARDWRIMAPLLSPLVTSARSNIAKWKAALRAYDGMRLPPQEWHIVRTIVLERDEHTCKYCGNSKRLHVDHKIPLARGGSNSFENLITSCETCNCSKGSKLLADWKPVLFRTNCD